MTESAGISSPIAENTSTERPLAYIPDNELVLRYLIFSSMNAGMASPAVSAMESLKKIVPFTGKISNHAFHKTAGRIFFGGKTLAEAEDKCRSLMRNKMGVIIDYAAPENTNGLPRDHYTREVPEHLKGVIKTCGSLKAGSPQTAALAIKISNLEEFNFLKEASQKIREGEPLGKLAGRYNELRDNFQSIVRDANAAHVRVYVDAEQSDINPIIRDLCYDAVANGYDAEGKKGLKLAMTLQCYLKETPEVITGLLARPRKERPDVKLVRGAYMGDKYKDELAYIWAEGKEEGKAHTDQCYDRSFERLYGQTDEITLATHNQKSLTQAADWMARHPSATKVNAATLLGMGDGLSAGPQMERLKYVPYGDDVGYFLRRGVEFAMNPVTLDDGRAITRGQAELEQVEQEIKTRISEKKIPLLDTIVAMRERGQNRER